MNADKEAVSRLQEVIGYRFKDPDLLTEALSHTSYTNERKLNKTKSYQRLEFLGDAVLELFSSKYLYDLYPDHKEGELTKERASMVCEQSLAVCARHINLGDYILLGVGEAFWCQSLQNGTHHRIRTGIPTGGKDADTALFTGNRHQRLPQVIHLPVDVEGIHGTNPLTEHFFRILRHRAGRRA